MSVSLVIGQATVRETVSGVSPCANIRHGNTPFLIKKTLFLEEPTAERPKHCVNDDGNKYFVVIKYKVFQFDDTTFRN